MSALARASPLVLVCLIAAGCGGGSGGAHTSTSGERPASSTATRKLGSVVWQGMRITARAGPPAPLVIFNGASEQALPAPRHHGVQLTVTLTDTQSAVAIPYATVTATVTRGTKIVDRDRMWPMISPDSAPGYVGNVSLPAGAYRLQLAITPPVSARHVEYQHVWLHSHSVSLPFSWGSGT
jgi:Fe2+ transport protein